MKLPLILIALTSCVLTSASVRARDLWVNPRTGSETATGLAANPTDSDGPTQTIKRAIALANPGDSIHLDPESSPYYEQVLFANKSGEPGQPIILDGHGATIEGTIPLKPDEWTLIKDGLYKSDAVPRDYCYQANPAYVGRFFFLLDGKMNRMGRSLKGSNTPYKNPLKLDPGEWTYVEAEKAFYLQLPVGATIEQSGVRVPKIVSGIQITGNCHDLTIRNITATHVINDGFALTVGQKGNTVRNIHFENITAIECGDDGLSAHGDCEVFVDGFLSRGNSTGYCSQGVSSNRRVRIEDIDGVEIYPIGGRHEFIDCLVIGHALRPVTLEPSPPFSTTALVLKNCLLLGAPNRTQADSLVRVMKGGTLEAENLTTQGMGFVVWGGGSVHLSNSLLAGGNGFLVQVLPEGRWSGSNNIYDLGSFQVGDKRISGRDFSAFTASTGETDSNFQTVSLFSRENPPEGIPPNVGAELSKLPHRP